MGVGTRTTGKRDSQATKTGMCIRSLIVAEDNIYMVINMR